MVFVVGGQGFGVSAGRQGGVDLEDVASLIVGSKEEESLLLDGEVGGSLAESAVGDDFAVSMGKLVLLVGHQQILCMGRCSSSVQGCMKVGDEFGEAVDVLVQKVAVLGQGWA